jgi:hypothetical protein
MIDKMAGYAFRLCSLSYGGQVGSNPLSYELCIMVEAEQHC